MHGPMPPRWIDHRNHGACFSFAGGGRCSPHWAQKSRWARLTSVPDWLCDSRPVLRLCLRFHSLRGSAAISVSLRYRLLVQNLGSRTLGEYRSTPRMVLRGISRALSRSPPYRPRRRGPEQLELSRSHRANSICNLPCISPAMPDWAGARVAPLRRGQASLSARRRLKFHRR
jgi:hypothetical protein